MKRLAAESGWHPGMLLAKRRAPLRRFSPGTLMLWTTRYAAALATLTVLLIAASGSAQQPAVSLSPRAEPSVLTERDTAAMHSFPALIGQQGRWGTPSPDVSMVVAHFADSAVQLGRFGAIFRGKDQIHTWWTYMLGFGPISTMRLTLGSAPGLIYETGRYRHLVLRPDGRGRMYEDVGSYAWIWERQPDGAWRLQSAMMIPAPNPGSPVEEIFLVPADAAAGTGIPTTAPSGPTRPRTPTQPPKPRHP